MAGGPRSRRRGSGSCREGGQGIPSLSTEAGRGLQVSPAPRPQPALPARSRPPRARDLLQGRGSGTQGHTARGAGAGAQRGGPREARSRGGRGRRGGTLGCAPAAAPKPGAPRRRGRPQRGGAPAARGLRTRRDPARWPPELPPRMRGGAARPRMRRGAAQNAARGAGRGARRDRPLRAGGGRPRGPMGAAPGRPAPRRRTSVPGYGRRRCRVLELSARRRQPTDASTVCAGGEPPPGRRGAGGGGGGDAAAGGGTRAHGVHLTEELPPPGARPLPRAPRRRPGG